MADRKTSADGVRAGALVSILGNLGWLLGGKGVGAVLSLVYLGLAARTLGPAGFGQFSLIVGTAQAIVSFQSWQIVVRHGMAHLRARDETRLRRLAAFCIALDLMTAVLGCGLAWAAIVWLAPRLGWTPALSRAALGFCLVSLLSVRSTAVGVLRLYDRFDLGAAADATTPLMRFVGALAVVAAGATVGGFLAAWAAAEIVTAGAYWLAVRRVTGPGLRLPTLRGAAGAARDNPGLWRFSWTTNLVLTLEAASRQVAVVLVGLVTGPVAAGNYRLASQLSQSIIRVSDMASRAIFAEFARSAGSDDTTRADPRRLFRHVTRLAVVAAVGLLLVLGLGRPGLRLLTGPGHEAAYPLLRLRSIAAAIELAGIGFEPALLALGFAGRALAVRCVAAMVLLVGLAALLPVSGGIGAAWATLLASAIGTALLGRAALRALPRRALPRRNLPRDPGGV